VFSSTLSWTFTVVFTLTGVYSTVRLAELTSGIDRTGNRLVELSHLVMSLAMIAMAWAWTGDPSSPTGLLQIVVFGLFGIWFLARLTVPEGDHSRANEGYHLVTNAAMVWMVAAMPQIMGADTSAAEAAAHHGGDGMTGMAGMAMPASTPPSAPGWVVAVSGVFVVLLVAGAVLWTSRIVRPGASGGCAGAPTAAEEKATSEGSVAIAAAPAGTRSTGARFDAGCHVLMSLAMAGMLLAML
jgi:hypothetical protein